MAAGPILANIDEMDLPIAPEDEPPCRCVLAQCETLKAEYAAILRREVVDGAPVITVAPELGLTPNNAMVRLHRARTALRKRMAEHCGTTTTRSCTECGCVERGCCPPPERAIDPR